MTGDETAENINKQFRELIKHHGLHNVARVVGCHCSALIRTFKPGARPSLHWISLVAHAMGYEMRLELRDAKSGELL